MSKIKEIFKLMDKRAVAAHAIQLKHFFNKDFKFEDVVDSENKIDDFIKMDESLGLNVLQEIKHFTPIHEIREEIIKEIQSGEYVEFKVIDDKQTVIFKNEIYIAYHKWQRFVLELLYKAYKEETYVMSTNEIFNAIEEASITGDDFPQETKISHLFKGKAGNLILDNIIVTQSKGKYRINLP